MGGRSTGVGPVSGEGSGSPNPQHILVTSN
jgi:hypothetical protein